MKLPFLTAVLLLAGAGAAMADPLDDCRQRRSLALQVEGCTAVVDGPVYSAGQKALAYRSRGNARAAAGAFAEALSDLDAAIRLAPGDAAAYAARGEVRLSRGDHKGAIGDLEQAVRIGPRATSLLVALGHARLVAGDAKAALADFDAALAIEPGSAVALNNRGLAHRRLGELERAIRDYTAAIQINPVYALAYANRGHAREAEGRKSDAIEDLRMALMLAPTMTSARDSLNRLGAGEQTAESDAMVKEGRVLAERYCGWCHAIGGGGVSTNPKAPPFRDLHRRHPLLALRQPMTRGIAAPHDEMPRLPLSVAEVDRIVAYVGSLEQPQ
jgi:tetratricopeptide (TPR) repeat protein